MNRRRYRSWRRRNRTRNFRVQLAILLGIIVCISASVIRHMMLDDMLTVGAVLLIAGFATGILATPFIRPVTMLSIALFSFSGCYVLAISIRWDVLFHVFCSAMVLCLALAVGASVALIPAVTRFSWAVASWSVTPMFAFLGSFVRVRAAHLYKKLASLV